MKKYRLHLLLGLTCLLVGSFYLLQPSGVNACGGLFCQNTPVDQAAERIIFTKNDDGTITTLVEIQYTGAAPDFSWILPIPEAISADDLAVPEDGDQIFPELHQLTDVRFVNPDRPECVDRALAEMAEVDLAVEDSGVEIFASGEVGPYGFDVIGSDDPNALINWLRDNQYRVEPPMEPLINVYVDEQFAFIAMRLLDGETADSIAPIEITYGGEKPMIPLRLTAVAANPNMRIFTWFFADEQAVPDNYAHMEIDNREITLFNFGGNDYYGLVRLRADAFNGKAFITEFAGPHATQFSFVHPYLREKAAEHPYLTRLATIISPEEMTLDPIFTYDSGASDVSNVRDLSNLTGLYVCERERALNIGLNDAINSRGDDGSVTQTTPLGGRSMSVGWVAIGLWIVTILVGGAYFLGRRQRRS